MSKINEWIEFKPSKKWLTKVLGDLEADVMEAIWKLKVGRVKEIHKEVSQKRKVAITTVATVLDRLYEKGLVERYLKSGRGLYYEYTPAITRKQFERDVVKAILEGLFETFGDSTISFLIDHAGIKDKTIVEEFKRHLKRLKKKKEKARE